MLTKLQGSLLTLFLHEFMFIASFIVQLRVCENQAMIKDFSYYSAINKHLFS